MICGVIAGYNSGKIADELLQGAQSVFVAAMAIGVARGIGIVMANGMIQDTIVHALAQVLNGLPAALVGIGMFLVQTILNFFIPSGSGQASTTMPIMTPLADIVGISRQTAVLAFQFGDGFTNAIIPTHGTLCASLGVAGIPFNKWFKFALPVVAVELLICSAFVIFAAVTGYGPF